MIHSSQNSDVFKKFLTRPQTVESNYYGLQTPTNNSSQVNKQSLNTPQESRSRNESHLAINSPKEGQSQNGSIHISGNPQNPFQKGPVPDYMRKCQTCVPGSRSHSYGHIPLQNQVRFISKKLDDKTQFKLEILKQKLSKEQERKEHQQLTQFVSRWAKERRQLMQLKNSRNEMTFQCNDFGKLKYQKKDLQLEVLRSIQSQQSYRKTKDSFFPGSTIGGFVSMNTDIPLENNISFLSPAKNMGDLYQSAVIYSTPAAEYQQQQTRQVSMLSNENAPQINPQISKQESLQAKKQNLDDSEIEQKINKNLFNNDSDDEQNANEKSFQGRQKSKSRDLNEELAGQIQIYSYINQQTVEDKIKIGDIYKKIESFDSYNPYSQEERQKSAGTEKYDLNNNDNENSPSREYMKNQFSHTPQLQKNKSFNQEGNGPQTSSNFRTGSSFFPSNQQNNFNSTFYNNQIPTMETINQIQSRQSSSQRTRNNFMSETLFNFQQQRQKPQLDSQQSAKRPVSVDLFGIGQKLTTQQYDKRLGYNHLNTENNIVQEIKKNKIKQLIQTKGKVINLQAKDLPIISQQNHQGDNELTEDVIKERLSRSIMMYSTKIKEYQQQKCSINTANKKSISDKQVNHDQIDEINKVRTILSKKNIKINAQNLKSSLITPLLPVPDLKQIKNKRNYLPDQGAHLLSTVDY